MRIAFAAAAACLFAQTDAKRGGAVISVANELTGQPIAEARVQLAADPPCPGRFFMAKTDQHGVARLEDLPPETFHVSIIAKGYVDSGYAGAKQYRVTPGAADVSLKVTLAPTATIAGRVLGEDNEPLADVHIHAESGSGPPMFGKSGADGSYRIEYMRPGPFRFRLTVPVARIKAAMKRRDGEQWSYPNASWHPAVESQSAAEVVTLAPGVQWTDFDLRMRREQLVEIRGQVIDAETREPLVGAEVELAPDTGGFSDEALNRRAVSGDGAFHFPFARPGGAWLLVYRGSTDRAIPFAARIDVGRAGVTGFQARVPRFHRIDGRIRPEPPAGSEVALNGGRVGWGRVAAKVGAGGRFAFDNVPPGPVRFSADLKTYYVRRIRMGGRDVAVSPWMTELIMPDGAAELEIDIANETGSVRGRAVDDKGDPMPHTRVTVGPGVRSMGHLTDQSGAFQVELPPGEYELGVCAGRGEKVRVEVGATVSVVLRGCAIR